jgi:hypothetical protein
MFTKPGSNQPLGTAHGGHPLRNFDVTLMGGVSQEPQHDNAQSRRWIVTPPAQCLDAAWARRKAATGNV